jgi:iron complex transport system ATP-binding protein
MLLVDDLGIVRGSRRILEAVSFGLAAGEFLGVIGPNGAGKSSLVRALTGEWASTGGVRLFGYPIAAWRRADLACRVAVMPQSAHLNFDFTVREVVELGRLPHRRAPPATNRAAVDGALGALDLDPWRDRLYTRLSGGERQRVQFARVLAQVWDSPDPSLLILDEATSALDLAQQKAVLDLAQRHAQRGGAVLAVLHDLNLAARYAGRLMLMKQGRVVADAAPEGVITTARLAEAFTVDAAVDVARCDGRPVVVIRPGAAGRLPDAAAHHGIHHG